MRSRLYHRAVVCSILVCAGATGPPVLAQQDDEQLWLQLNTSVPLAPKLRVTLEQIVRTSDRFDGVYQTEFGGILGYKVAHNVELGLGYRRVGSHNPNPAADEDRVRQHVIAAFGPITTRFRVDERFHPAGDEIGFRIRPLVRYNYRLGARGWGLFASHESFILPNSTAWGQRAGYDRMRNVAGVVIPFAEAVSGDLGYLNQYRFARGGSRAVVEHALSFQLTINLRGLVHPKADD